MSDKKRSGISSITIENFKGIGAPVTMPLKPITLLFGANSAGKSTILKSLAYLREALKTWKHPEQIHISGETVATGDFRSVVHRHDEKRKIRIAVEVPRPEPISPDKDEKKKTRTWADVIETIFSGFSVETLRIEVAVSGNQSSAAELWLNNELILWVQGESIELNPDAGFVKKYFLEWDRRDEEDWFTKEELESADLHFLLTLEDPIDFSRPWSSYVWEAEPWSDDDIGKAREAAKLSYELCAVLFGGLDRHLGNQRYIGPLRDIPDRHQRFDAIAPNSWYTGLAAWRELERILRRENPYHLVALTGISLDGEINSQKLETIGVAEQALQEIARLDLGYKPTLKTIFSIEQIQQEIPEWNNKRVSADEELNVLLQSGEKPTRSDTLILLSKDGVPVCPCDVGAGVSQALPIAVGAFAEGCRLMMVEQPELHLHPRLQCDLADVFVANIHRHVERKFLIETHSEHLILRLLRRIRETSVGEIEKNHQLALTPDDVGVLYVDEAKDGTRVQELRIGADGHFIDEWPDGFFEEGYSEVVGGL